MDGQEQLRFPYRRSVSLCQLAPFGLADEQARGKAAAEDEQAREMGVSGVPCFIFNGRTAVSGAHEPQTLLQAMLQSESETADER